MLELIYDSGILLLGIMIGALAVVLPVWTRNTDLEYKNCALRRRIARCKEIIKLLVQEREQLNKEVPEEAKEILLEEAA